MKLKDLFLEYDPDYDVWVVVDAVNKKSLGKFDTYPKAKKFALEGSKVIVADITNFGLTPGS